MQAGGARQRRETPAERAIIRGLIQEMKPHSAVETISHNLNEFQMTLCVGNDVLPAAPTCQISGAGQGPSVARAGSPRYQGLEGVADAEPLEAAIGRVNAQVLHA